MKKFTILFLIFLCLSFNTMGIKPAAAFGENTFKQGVYTLSQLNILPDKLYDVTNTSSEEGALVLVYDENEVEQQVIRLKPGGASFNLVPMKPGYKVVILGDVSEVFISPRKTNQ
ncbi:MAG: hypothetical protein ABRQ27_07500 [Clostridiaceae bacterium]